MAAEFIDLALVATLFLSSAPTVSSKAQTVPNTSTPPKFLIAQLPTTFQCIKDNNGFATIAQRGDRTTPPIITWNATLGQYTPRQRCYQVSQKLTQAVANNGGRLHDLVLTDGTVNSQKVICVVNSSVQTACSSANLLFTLRPENAKRAGEVIGRLHNFSIMGTGTPVEELAGENFRSLFNRNFLPLERLNQFLGPEAQTRESTNLF